MRKINFQNVYASWASKIFVSLLEGLMNRYMVNKANFCGFRITYIAQCVYTQSHAYMAKIPATYLKAPTTNFRLFWDADSWNFSNIKTINAFRTLWLLPVLAPFFKVSIVKESKIWFYCQFTVSAGPSLGIIKGLQITRVPSNY